MRARAYRGRHRLGMPGLVHCALHTEVAVALAEHRRSWLTTLLVPAQHSIAGLRRRTVRPEQSWAPATA